MKNRLWEGLSDHDDHPRRRVAVGDVPQFQALFIHERGSLPYIAITRSEEDVGLSISRTLFMRFKVRLGLAPGNTTVKQHS